MTADRIRRQRTCFGFGPAPKVNVRDSIDCDTDAVSGSEKTALVLSTEVVNRSGKLAKITAHRRAQMHLPYEPVVAADAFHKTVLVLLVSRVMGC